MFTATDDEFRSISHEMAHTDSSSASVTFCAFHGDDCNEGAREPLEVSIARMGWDGMTWDDGLTFTSVNVASATPGKRQKGRVRLEVIFCDLAGTDEGSRTSNRMAGKEL